MNYNTISEFNKDFKRLSKKFRSLENDLNEIKKVLNRFPFGMGKHFNIITRNEPVSIIKARLFCRDLKNKDLRIIYGYIESRQQIDFIEIYFKGKKNNEDKERIKTYLNNYN